MIAWIRRLWLLYRPLPLGMSGAWVAAAQYDKGGDRG